MLLSLFLFCCLTTYGQNGMWKPFKLCVIQPDTAVIDQSLFSETDSIVATQLKRYYKSVDIMEKLVNCIGCQRDPDETEKMKQELTQLKSYESEAKRFKYFHLISSYSTEVYNFYFNEYEPYSTIIELPKQKTDIISLKNLADTAKADYIVFFSKIHSVDKDGLLTLKLTTSLYSKKDSKVILAKETEGDTISSGGLWTCGNTTLSCLLINAVKTSTDGVANVLRKKQIRMQ